MFQPAMPLSTLKIAQEKKENATSEDVQPPALQFVLTNKVYTVTIQHSLTKEKALNYIYFAYAFIENHVKRIQDFCYQ